MSDGIRDLMVPWPDDTTAFDVVKAPFPWFGGKSRAAAMIWRRLGQVRNYIEPFAGSLAVMLRSPYPPARYETVNDLDNYVCVVPQTRILLPDLTWRRAGDILPGDDLLGFNEENPVQATSFGAPKEYRKWQHSRAVSTMRLAKPCYRLTFDDGTVVVASDDHCWLSGSHKPGKHGRAWRWIKTKNLVCNRETQRSWVLRVAPPDDQETTWDSGWMAGFADGEGHCHCGPGCKLSLAQKPGPSLDRAEAWLTGHGFSHRRTMAKSGTVSLGIGGGLQGAMRFLMLTRPERLIAQLSASIERCTIYGRERQAVGLVSKEYVGAQEVVALRTTTHTYVAEGLASHNCNLWRALQPPDNPRPLPRGNPELVARVADQPVNEANLTAFHRWLMVKERKEKFRKRMLANPEYYDAAIAGIWVWGQSCWIGAGWCDAKSEWHGYGDNNTGRGMGSKRPCCRRPGALDALGIRPGLTEAKSITATPEFMAQSNRGVVSGSMPQVTHEQEVHACGNPAVKVGRPHLQRPYQVSAKPCNVPHKLPAIAAWKCQSGLAMQPNQALLDWLLALSARLRYVRVCCGDWRRIMGKAVLTAASPVGIVLDPPYSTESGRDMGIYSHDSGDVAHDVRQWCVENGDNLDLRIVLCGYEGEGHDALLDKGWTVEAWKASGGYGRLHGVEAGTSLVNRHRERLYYSPGCLPPVGSLGSMSLFSLLEGAE